MVTLLFIAAAVTLLAWLPLALLLEPLLAATAALVVAGAFVLAVGACTVSALELDETGIRFRRLAGRPRFLPWQRISALRRADRAEIVLRGWLWPPLPPRAAALTLSSLGHYRIDWDGGSCYFPPADEAAFLQFVERVWGGAL